MERTKETNLFQDLWCFLKKWFWDIVFILCSITLIYFGFCELSAGVDYRQSGDLLNAIYYNHDGFLTLFLGLFVITFRSLCYLLKSSGNDPDEKKEN